MKSQAEVRKIAAAEVPVSDYVPMGIHVGSVALATDERDFGRDECHFLKLDGFALPMHKTARQKTA